MKTKQLILILLILLVTGCQAQASQNPATARPDAIPDLATSTPAPSEPPAAQSGEQTIYIGAARVPCDGVAPQTCYQYRQDPATEWGLFYDQIEGFAWEPGFEYQLQVAIETVENPPADASAVRYTLLNVVAQNRIAPRPGQFITITTPESMVIAGGQIIIAGMGAGLFEGTLVVQLLDEEREIQLTQATTLATPDAGTGGEGPWQIEVEFPVTQRTPLTIYAFATSAMDGSVVADARKELVLVPSLEVNVELENTPWRLVSVPGADVDALLAGISATLTFDASQSRIFGAAGCNNYFSDYSLDGGKLSLGPIGATMMMCPDPQMWVEQAFLQALDQARLYQLEGELLVLFDDSGTRLLEFEIDPQ